MKHRHLDCSLLTTEENLALSFGCEETLAGLYHTLNVMGEILLTMAGENPERMSNESVSQLGYSLMNISQLIPALAELEVKADQQLFFRNPLKLIWKAPRRLLLRGVTGLCNHLSVT